jgi:hypothetical protein
MARPRPGNSSEVHVELIVGLIFVIALCAFGGLGLAVGASAEGPDPDPPLHSPMRLRLTRAALLASAAYLSLLGAGAAAVGAWLDDPAIGRAEAVVFLLEGAVDLGLALFVLLPGWTLRRVWLLRLVATCWLVVGPPAVVFTLGRGPLATFYLGFEPAAWAVFSVVIGATLVWLASLGGGTVEAESSRKANGPKTPHARGILAAIALACVVAVSSWPMAQFAGVLTMGSCTPQWLVPSNPGFCVRGEFDRRMLTVSGETTLPDGALVDVTVTSDDYPLIDRPANLRVAVKDGAWEAVFDMSRDRSSPITVTAEFSLSGQPAEAQQRYGEKGSSLNGPAARDGGPDLGRNLLVTLHMRVG